MKRISLKKLSPLLAAVPAALLLFSGCGKQAATSDTDSTAANKGKIRLAYVNWSEGVAVTHLFASLLDDMGYEVETTMADVAPIYVSVAEGKQDVMVETWLPTTHKAYAEQYGSRLETVSTWFEGAKIGLVVPDYVEINSIDELNAAKDKFKGKIIGVDAGAGIMGSTDQRLCPRLRADFLQRPRHDGGTEVCDRQEGMDCRNRLGTSLEVRPLRPQVLGRSQNRLRRCRTHRSSLSHRLR